MFNGLLYTVVKEAKIDLKELSFASNFGGSFSVLEIVFLLD